MKRVYILKYLVESYPRRVCFLEGIGSVLVYTHLYIILIDEKSVFKWLISEREEKQEKYSIKIVVMIDGSFCLIKRWIGDWIRIIVYLWSRCSPNTMIIDWYAVQLDERGENGFYVDYMTILWKQMNNLVLNDIKKS